MLGYLPRAKIKLSRLNGFGKFADVMSLKRSYAKHSCLNPKSPLFSERINQEVYASTQMTYGFNKHLFHLGNSKQLLIPLLNVAADRILFTVFPFLHLSNRRSNLTLAERFWIMQIR